MIPMPSYRNETEFSIADPFWSANLGSSNSSGALSSANLRDAVPFALGASKRLSVGARIRRFCITPCARRRIRFRNARPGANEQWLGSHVATNCCGHPAAQQLPGGSGLVVSTANQNRDSLSGGKHRRPGSRQACDLSRPPAGVYSSGLSERQRGTSSSRVPQEYGCSEFPSLKKQVLRLFAVRLRAPMGCGRKKLGPLGKWR
jgi:hypothetical protein